MASSNKLYNLLKVCKSQIKALEEQHFADCTFSAHFFIKGKKSPNAIHNAPVESFSNLVRSYEKTELPDSIKIELFGNRAGSTQKLELFTKTFDTSSAAAIEGRTEVVLKAEQSSNVFAGLGEAEVMAMVHKKVAEIDNARELENVKRENETLKREYEDLKQQNETLEARYNAHSTIETYASIASKAAPLLSAIFGTHPLLSTATNLLSGTSNPNADKVQVETNTDDTKLTMYAMISDYMKGLNDTALAQLFDLVGKLEQDQNLLARITQTLKQ